MSKTVILQINKPHFTLSLYESMLKIDVKGSVKNEIEEALENKPVLRQTMGSILGLFAPLHIRLSDIDSVKTNETGRVKIILPRHRDVAFPLEPSEAKKLVDKLNELIPGEKRRELLRLMREHGIQKAAEERLDLGRAAATFPTQEGVELLAPEIEEQIEETAEREEQKEED